MLIYQNVSKYYEHGCSLLVTDSLIVFRNGTTRRSNCHWNLNSISAHNYIKVSLLRAHISTHKFDVISISETYRDSNTTDDDDNLKIAGYNLI